MLHPRPQLTREQWIDLNGVWGFTYDDADVGIDARWFAREDGFERQIMVPFPPESRASGIGDNGMHPVVWYHRVVSISASEVERLLLHFGAVDYRAQVWVNGHLVVTHEGGHTPFHADIAPVLRADTDVQHITVRAEDLPTDLAQPRGKQFWEAEPRDIWYTRTTGIWQPVWLEPVPKTYITTLRWTPELDRGHLGMSIKINHIPTESLIIRARLYLHDVLIADERFTIFGQAIHRNIGLEGARNMNWREVIWSPDYPNLVDAIVTLLNGDTVLDEVRSYAGLRTVGVNNGFFLLNNAPKYLRLVLGQGYWEDTNLTPPSLDALREEVEWIRRLGFNGVRIHQKIEDPRFLYWCDRLGVMVWGEMPSAHVFNPEAVERFTREWMDVIERDYSHPCIICWVPFNESWGLPLLERDRAQQGFVRSIYHLTHALDQTRPVIGNDGWEHTVSDVWGIHDYATEGDSLRERYGSPESVERTLTLRQPQFRALMLPGSVRGDEPIMVTEFGGIAFAPVPGEPWFGYGTVNNTEEFLAKYAELVNALLDSPTLVGFCYTQLTDVQQETNGLLTVDRKSKLDVDQIYAITRRPSKALPGEVLTHIHQAAEALLHQTETGAS